MIATVVIVSVTFWALLSSGKRNTDRIREAAAAKAASQGQTPGVMYLTDFGQAKPTPGSAAPKTP
jgi:hypothetical protein